MMPLTLVLYGWPSWRGSHQPDIGASACAGAGLPAAKITILASGQ
jgi:hypothetical protein